MGRQKGGAAIALRAALDIDLDTVSQSLGGYAVAELGDPPSKRALAEHLLGHAGSMDRETLLSVAGKLFPDAFGVAELLAIIDATSGASASLRADMNQLEWSAAEWSAPHGKLSELLDGLLARMSQAPGWDGQASAEPLAGLAGLVANQLLARLGASVDDAKQISRAVSDAGGSLGREWQLMLHPELDPKARRKLAEAMAKQAEVEAKGREFVAGWVRTLDAARDSPKTFESRGFALDDPAFGKLVSVWNFFFDHLNAGEPSYSRLRLESLVPIVGAPSAARFALELSRLARTRWPALDCERSEATGDVAPCGRIWPRGRRRGVPLTHRLDARPWYATGRW